MYGETLEISWPIFIPTKYHQISPFFTSGSLRLENSIFLRALFSISNNCLVFFIYWTYRSIHTESKKKLWKPNYLAFRSQLPIHMRISFWTKHMKNTWFVLRFTWLSGAGKTTLSDATFARLQEMGVTTIQQLDGDLVREHLTKDLWFSKEDREENIKRISFIAGLLSQHGVGVLATFISPYIKMREMVRSSTTNFIEVFVNAPLSVCEDRDVKWLYAKARTWEIANFTGISDPYEAPTDPEIEVRTDLCSIHEWVDQVIAYLEENHYI